MEDENQQKGRGKKAISLIILFLAITFFIALFIFRDSLNSYASKAMRNQVTSVVVNEEAAFIDSAFNYAKNGEGFDATFLEFGANGCSSCLRMETEMSKIKTQYPDRVNVVFVNVLQPPNQRMMKYFGIVAIPTQVLLNKNGKESFRHTGYLSSEDILKQLNLGN